VSFHRDCVCGHMWAVHDHYRAGTDCSISGCGCRRYRPRRWWRRATPTERPAPGESAPQDPPDLPRPPVPGPPPSLRRLVWREDRLYCGCTYTYDLAAATMTRGICDVHAFDPADWNQRLTQ
jgi:hypothetical protein